MAPPEKVVLGVSKLDAPATVPANGTLTVVLTLETGACRSFDHIELSRDASTASLTVIGLDISNRRGTTCPEFLVETPYSFDLKPPFQGPFIVQVNRGRVSPLTATVQVQ